VRRCLVRAMYLSASEVAVSTMGRYNKCSTFYLYIASRSPITTSVRMRHDGRRMRREGGNVGVSPYNPTRLEIWGGGVVSSLAPSAGLPRPEMHFRHISGQKEAIWNTLLTDGWHPKRRGARENFPPFPPFRRADQNRLSIGPVTK